MFFYAQRYPDETNSPIFNSNCQNIILLDKIKEQLNLIEHDTIDIISMNTKECFMLHTKPKNYASDVLKQGETYALCAIKIEKTRIDEEELKKKKKKIPENVVDGFEIKMSFVPVEQVDNHTTFDFSKIQAWTGRRSRGTNRTNK
jgi:hypothetical protein